MREVIKKCISCKKSKKISNFYKSKTYKNGADPYCSACRREKYKPLEYQFGGNREKAIVRDKERCVSCKLTREKHKTLFGIDITVDHISGDRSNNDLSNLKTLCSPCHGRKDIVRSPNTAPKEIVQLTLLGKKIKTWPSINSVSRELGFSTGSIWCCLEGMSKVSHGYRWERVR